MDTYKHDSYCGIYCGACDIMMAHRTGSADRFASFWSRKTLKKFLRFQHIDFRSDEELGLECHGCKSGRLFINCRACKMRECALSKRVGHCIDCGEYPCRLYRDWKKMERMLPHLKETGKNLETIQKAGVETWLGEQEARWRCPGCGSGYAWYSETCGSCGKDLKQFTNKFPRVRSMLMRIAISLASLGK